MWLRVDVGNWNLVVNGGLSIAALAIADHNDTVHSLASQVVSHAVSGMRHAFASYAPDGVWPGTSYFVLRCPHPGADSVRLCFDSVWTQ